jgi:hypothetical protein
MNWRGTPLVDLATIVRIHRSGEPDRRARATTAMPP